MNEPLVWKAHNSPVGGDEDGQSKQCHTKIDHFTAFTVISTRTHHETLADNFSLLACTTGCGNNARKIEVYCVHDDVSAIEVSVCACAFFLVAPVIKT